MRTLLQSRSSSCNYHISSSQQFLTLTKWQHHTMHCTLLTQNPVQTRTGLHTQAVQTGGRARQNACHVQPWTTARESKKAPGCKACPCHPRRSLLPDMRAASPGCTRQQQSRCLSPGLASFCGATGPAARVPRRVRLGCRRWLVAQGSTNAKLRRLVVQRRGRRRCARLELWLCAAARGRARQGADGRHRGDATVGQAGSAAAAVEHHYGKGPTTALITMIQVCHNWPQTS